MTIPEIPEIENRNLLIVHSEDEELEKRLKRNNNRLSLSSHREEQMKIFCTKHDWPQITISELEAAITVFLNMGKFNTVEEMSEHINKLQYEQRLILTNNVNESQIKKKTFEFEIDAKTIGYEIESCLGAGPNVGKLIGDALNFVKSKKLDSKRKYQTYFVESKGDSIVIYCLFISKNELTNNGTFTKIFHYFKEKTVGGVYAADIVITPNGLNMIKSLLGNYGYNFYKSSIIDDHDYK